MEIQCCMCHKIQRGADWVAPGDGTSTKSVSHSYCPVCARQAFKEIRAAKTVRINQQMLIASASE